MAHLTDAIALLMSAINALFPPDPVIAHIQYREFLIATDAHLLYLNMCAEQRALEARYATILAHCPTYITLRSLLRLQAAHLHLLERHISALLAAQSPLRGTVASEQIADGVYRCKRVVRAQCNDEIAVARIRLERVGWIANAADFAAYKKLRNRTERAVLTIQTRHNGTLLQVYKTLMSALDAEFWECDGVNCNL